MQRQVAWLAVAPMTALLLATPAPAETSRSFAVAATIQPGCAVDGIGMTGNSGTIGTLAFGSYPTLSTNTAQASLTDTQSITLRCTQNVMLSITVDGGLHQAAGTRNLQLASNTAARLAYTLCTDASCTQPIGIGQSTTHTVTSANMNNVRLPIVGRLTLPGNANAGTFTDTLTITLSW